MDYELKNFGEDTGMQTIRIYEESTPEVAGTTPSVIVNVLIDRLTEQNNLVFSAENDAAIRCLRESLEWIERRSARLLESNQA